ncbi:MAG: PRC-barrel domain-containing protein [Phycisphaeraceae bacterium]
MADVPITCVSRLLHHPVRNLQGQSLGEIEELVIDAGRGFIAYVVLIHPASAGVTRKRFAIPWHALSMDQAHGCLRLNLALEVLSEAPGLPDAATPARASARPALAGEAVGATLR